LPVQPLWIRRYPVKLHPFFLNEQQMPRENLNVFVQSLPTAFVGYCKSAGITRSREPGKSVLPEIPLSG
jgi:hypothetical protein